MSKNQRLEQLTEIQIAEIREIFTLFDKNSDGYVNTNELGTILRALQMNPTQAEVKEMALSILRGSHGMRTDRWAYMRYTDGSEELYDMKNDPEQFTNLAPSTEHQDQMERQRKLLEKRLKEIE